MRQLLRRFWKDDRGAVIASEWAFVATILVLVMAVSWLATWQDILTALEETASHFAR